VTSVDRIATELDGIDILANIDIPREVLGRCPNRFGQLIGAAMNALPLVTSCRVPN
jgi:hypothetical protein